MTQDTIDKTESYKLSESEKKDLLAGVGELKEPSNSETLSQLSEDLRSARENADKGVAWITGIVPPDGSRKAPGGSEEISVEFMMEGGHTFWETYDYDESYLPEDHDFVNMVNHVGYEINALQHVIKEKIDVVYDERKGKWKVDPEVYGRTLNESTDNSNSTEIGVSEIVYGLLAVFLGLLLIAITVRTRGLALFLILVITVVFYLIRSLVNS